MRETRISSSTIATRVFIWQVLVLEAGAGQFFIAIFWRGFGTPFRHYLITGKPLPRIVPLAGQKKVNSPLGKVTAAAQSRQHEKQVIWGIHVADDWAARPGAATRAGSHPFWQQRSEL
jgi:hypothetical protein